MLAFTAAATRPGRVALENVRREARTQTGSLRILAKASSIPRPEPRWWARAIF